MAQLPAKDVKVDQKIIDKDGYEIEVTETWPEHGPGTGVVIKGNLVSVPSKMSFNRYYNPDELVETV